MWYTGFAVAKTVEQAKTVLNSLEHVEELVAYIHKHLSDRTDRWSPPGLTWNCAPSVSFLTVFRVASSLRAKGYLVRKLPGQWAYDVVTPRGQMTMQDFMTTQLGLKERADRLSTR